MCFITNLCIAHTIYSTRCFNLTRGSDFLAQTNEMIENHRDMSRSQLKLAIWIYLYVIKSAHAVSIVKAQTQTTIIKKRR